jgi:hypothetical protein
MHKTENEGSIFTEGLKGWGVLLSKFKRQQPEQFSQQPNQQQQPQKPPLLPKKEGWSI